MPLAVPGAPAALVIAHPGHELRVYGWLQLVSPLVFVLTDGSGRSGQSRVGLTTKLLAQTGVQPGDIYARLTDLEVYTALLDHDFALFISLAEELAEVLIRGRMQYVVGDAAEGYNPAHDVCRLVINTAVDMAKQRGGWLVANCDFSLVGRPDTCPEELRPRAIRLQLDDTAFARKRAAARGYAELAREVADTLVSIGEEAFRVECLRPVDSRAADSALAEEPPFYEWYGEQQVAAGYYKNVIRYREHVAPLAEALRRCVAGNRL